jgi:outer membrane receptor protein involved in Fe transport
LDQPPPVQVEVVEVYPPRLAPLGGEAAFSAVRIDPQVLRTQPTLDQALESAPGVSLFRRTTSVSANPTTQGMSLRSIAPSGAGRALVTLDGAPLNDPFGGWVIWTAIPPEDIETATVVRGAGAGPYGAGALTGVVALTERPSQDGLSALGVSGGDRRSYRGAGVFGGPEVLVSASGETTEGYIPVRGAAQGKADTPTDLNDGEASIRLQHRFDGIDTALRLGGFQERRGAGLAGARSTASGTYAAVTLGQAPQQAVGGWRLQLWARTSDLQNSSVAVAANRASTTPSNNEYSTPALGLGFNAALQGKAGAVSWEAGVDGRSAKGTEWENMTYVAGAFTKGRKAGGETLVAGVYVEGAYDQGPWIVDGGVRLDEWKTLDGMRREWVLATQAVTLNQTYPDKSGTTPTARIGARYLLIPELWLRAAAYEGFRPPTLNELYRPFRVGNTFTDANPNLRPEKLSGVEAGLGGDVGAHWTLTSFYNWLKDPVVNVTLGVGPGTFPNVGTLPAGGLYQQRQNAGEIKAYGVEGDANGAVTDGLFWRAAFAWTHARVDGQSVAPQLTAKHPAQAPELTATAGFEWRPMPRLSLGADVRYETKRFDDDQNTRILRAGAWADARIAWWVTPQASVYLSAENIADADIETAVNSDGSKSLGEPRTVRIGFDYRR